MSMNQDELKRLMRRNTSSQQRIVAERIGAAAMGWGA